MKTTFILALVTAFLTLSTASFAADCGAIDNTSRVGQETAITSDDVSSEEGKVEIKD